MEACRRQGERRAALGAAAPPPRRRRDPRRALEIREEYNRAIEESRLAHQAAIQDHLVEERLAVDATQRTAERLIAAAAIEYERALAFEEARLRSELAAFPEARRAQEAHDRRVAEIRSSSEQAKEALFQKFTRERRARR
jgi:hypothetical protein